MNKFILNELKKCKLAIIPPFNENDTVIHIIKGTDGHTFTPEIGKYYRIKLEDYIIHPYDGFDLHSNWNGGIVPTDYDMNVEIKNVMGKMVQVIGAGVNDRKGWGGWLPLKGFKVLEEI